MIQPNYLVYAVYMLCALLTWMWPFWFTASFKSWDDLYEFLMEEKFFNENPTPFDPKTLFLYGRAIVAIFWPFIVGKVIYSEAYPRYRFIRLWLHGRLK